MGKRRIIIITFFLLALTASSLIILKKSAVERRLAQGKNISLLLLTLQKAKEPESLKDILLVNYQPESKRLTLVVIPSQTLISDKRKLETLYRQSLGGNDLQGACLSIKDAIEKFLNLEIPFYLVFDEEEFIRVIDLWGGIEVEIDQPIPYREGFLERGGRLGGALHQTVQGGALHQMVLGGDESLAYLEFEEPRFGEFGKFSRWKRFIWALIQKFNNPSSNTELVKGLLKNSLLTDLKAADILALAQEADNIREAGIGVEKIPGKTIYRDWMSYWQVDTLATTQLFKELDKGLEEKEEIIRVEVLNGCGRAGIAFQLARDLRKEGLDVVNIGNARNFKYRKTLILNKSGKKGLAGKVARAIGCGEPQDRIEKKALVDVTVIIGKDYLRAE